MRILIGPSEVAGIGAGLAAGFDALGVEVELVLSQPHPFNYDLNRQVPYVARIWQALGQRSIPSPTRSPWQQRPFWVAWKLWGLVVLVWALARFDAFVFLFGNTLTNLRLEAWLLRILSKRAIVVYCGSDARPPYIDGLVLQANPPPTVEQITSTARRRAERVRRHERYGFTAVNAPSTGHFHSQAFFDWFAMGLPRAIDRAHPQPLPPRKSGRTTVRVLHSPSNRAIKGSDDIIRAIDELRARGRDIELVLLHGVTNDKVHEELALCDFIVDQLYSDTPLAGFAVEAAHYGKPAIVCGYAASPEHLALIEQRLPPSYFVLPGQLSEAIDELTDNVSKRHELGLAAQAFVRERWSPEAVATNYLAVLNGERPLPASIDPASIRYVHGCGIPEAMARTTVQQIVGAYGASALCLDHNPGLRDAFLSFAGLLPESER